MHPWLADITTTSPLRTFTPGPRVVMTDIGEPNTPKLNLIYILGFNNNSGTSITPIQLKGDNFQEWSRAICTSLTSKRKFWFYWWYRTKTLSRIGSKFICMLMSWLLNTLGSNLLFTVSFLTTLAPCGNTLKNVTCFCGKNDTRICQLKYVISECKQTPMESLIDYFGCLSR